METELSKKKGEAPEGQVWVCGACGKTSPNRYGDSRADGMWDASCFLNAVLCYSDSIERKDGRVIKAKPVKDEAGQGDE